MKNILRIFVDDTKRLVKNPIAIIVTIGLIVIPSLYAWANILSNWDPYGSTNNLKIAVANNDAGVTIEEAIPDYDNLPKGDKNVLDPETTVMNIGNNFVENLRENDKINWIFVDYDDALAGVENGEGREIRKVYFLENKDHAEDHFTLDPRDQINAIRDMRANGLKPLGNWHSHPSSPSRPSVEDIRLAFDSKASYLILSLMADYPVLNSFHIEGGEWTKEDLRIYSEEYYF